MAVEGEIPMSITGFLIGLACGLIIGFLATVIIIAWQWGRED